MSYENPGGPKGTLPNDDKKNESTNVPGGAGTLGYQDRKNSGIKSITDAINSTAPGAGPMETGTAGTYNFSKGFSLSDPSKPSFASESISSMKSAVSDASKPTSSYSQAEKEWKGAGEHQVKSIPLAKKTDYKAYSEHTKGGSVGTYLTTARKSKHQHPTAGDFLKDVNIHKDEGGNIIKNIPGESGKTRDRAIIHRKPPSDPLNIASSSAAAIKKESEAPSWSDDPPHEAPEKTKKEIRQRERFIEETAKTKKPTFRERREAKKEAKWKEKEEKGLQKTIKQRENYKGSGKSSNTPFVYDPS
jgi:hypothetical protein